jgi:hypothetical protein
MLAPFPRFSEPNFGWTKEQENTLHQKWNENPMRQKVLTTLGTNAARQTMLWKDMCEFFDCTPVELIGVQRSMRLTITSESYNQTPETRAKERSTFPYEPRWTGPFCDSLRKLIFLPIFQCNVNVLAMLFNLLSSLLRMIVSLGT